MATTSSSFEILLKLLVEGTGDLKALGAALQGVKDDAEGLQKLGELFSAKGLDVNLVRLEEQALAAYVAEMNRLKEAAAGAALALEAQAEVLRGQAFTEAAAKVELLNAEMDRLREKRFGQIEADTEKLAGEMERLREAAAGAALATQQQFERLREARLGQIAADAEALAIQMDRLREQSFGAAIAQTAKWTAEIEKLKEATAGEEIEMRRLAAFKVDLNVIDANLSLKQLRDNLVEAQVRLRNLVQTTGKISINSQEALNAREALGLVNTELQKVGNQIAALKGKSQGALAPLRQEMAATTASTDRLSVSVGGITRDLLLVNRAFLVFGSGLFGKQIIDVAIGFDRMHQSLSAVFGDAEKANEQFDFLKATAERLGLDITSLTDRYAKLTIAAREVGLNQEIIKDNFLAVSEAGARLHLSVEQIDGALLALEQIASKGKVSMEELRRQLGNSLPGAMSLAAKALDVTVPKLFQLVQAGQLSSEVFLTVFPAAIRGAFSVDANTRIETTQAAITRFTNALKFFIDEVVRADILKGFVNSLNDLAKALKDPAVIDTFKGWAKAISDVTTFMRENIDVVFLLIKAYAGVKIIGVATSVFVSLGASIASLNAALALANGAAPAAAATATAVAATGVAAAAATPAVATLGSVIKGLFAVVLHPLTIAVTVLGIAEIDFLVNRAKRADDAFLKLADTLRTIAADTRIAAKFKEQADSLKDFSDAAILNGTELKSLTAETIPLYQEGIDKAREFYEIDTLRLNATIDLTQKRIALLEDNNHRSAEENVQLRELTAQLKDLVEQQVTAVAQTAKYAEAVAAVKIAAGGAGLAVKDLSGSAKSIVQVFQQAVKGGEDLKASLEKAIPKDFATGGIKSIVETGRVIGVLGNEAGITAKVISETLGKVLDKVSGDDLRVLQFNMQQAFSEGKLGSQQLAIEIDGAVRAALKNLNVDSRATGENISRDLKNVSHGFLEIVSNIQVVAAGGVKYAGQLKAAIQGAIDTAKSREELKLLQDSLKLAGVDGKTFGDGIADSLLRLEARMLSLKGVLDSALGDSFKRFGIDTQEHLDAVALTAVNDFLAISESGLASARGVRDAFVKYLGQTELGRAFGDFGATSVLVLKDVENQARDSFALIRESGQATADVLIGAFNKLQAANLAAGSGTKNLTQDTLNLSHAIDESFKSGAISADNYSKAIFDASVATRDAIARPVGALSSALTTFGIKSRSELEAVAETARQAYNIILSSGNVTADGLATAAAKYRDAWIAAFGDVVKAAQDTENQLTTFQNTGFARNGPTINPAALKHASDSDIQSALKDLQAQFDFQTRPGSNPDTFFLGQLGDAIKKLTAELQLRAQAAAATAKTSNNGSSGVSPLSTPASTSGGGSTVNFNFYNTPITEDQVKQQIIPILQDFYARMR